MRFTLASPLVTLAVLAVAAASPTGQRNGVAIPITKRSDLFDGDSDKNIDFVVLNSHLASLKAKVLRGFENFERNTGTMLPSTMKGAGKRGAGIPLTDMNNQSWFGRIEVGTPPKPFTVLFDTGSSDTILPASTCGLTCDNHTRWNPKLSSTSKDLGKNFSLLFADGSTPSGELYTDTVSIGGITVQNQTLGAAEVYSDGLMGMAYPTLAAYNSSPVFLSLVSQGQVKDPRFSFKLSPSGAELYIGGTNNDLYTGEISYTPVTHKSYWLVMMDNVQNNGQKIISNINSIIDTGSTLIVGTPSNVSALYGAIGGKSVKKENGNEFYSFPCNSFPNISFTFGGKSFPIPASALNLGPVTNGSSQCLSSIVSHDFGYPVWIIGDVFLRNVYTVFDSGCPQVGFAELACE